MLAGKEKEIHDHNNLKVDMTGISKYLLTM